MSNQRILIVHDDRLLSNLYREKLEGSGFTVDSTRNPEQALKLVETKQPALILLDLVLQGGGGLAFIQNLRLEPATAALPVLIFPNVLGQLGNQALQAGANKIIPRGSNAIASVIDSAKIALGLPGLGEAMQAPLFSPDETWVAAMAGSAHETLNQMRHCLPGLVASSPDIESLANLWTLAHGFAERASLLGSKALAQTASTFDLLLADLHEMPEQINPSTTRTIGQAIDFLSQLSRPETLARVEASTVSRVLIVDDEESARQFITAAMQLADLRAECAASPTEAIEKLKDTTADLIFLDVGLPEKNGFELCTAIRSLDAHKKTPIVFLTGMATFQNRAQASLSGGNDFVGKPFNLPELALKALIWLYRGQLSLL